MNITVKQNILRRCGQISKGNMLETLSISFIDVGDDFLTAQMPVTATVHQYEGLLHGGASATLAETVGSVAAFVLSKREGISFRGLSLEINHISGISKGTLFATARAIHLGRTTQIWSIPVVNEANKLISHCKLTTIALIDAKK